MRATLSIVLVLGLTASAQAHDRQQTNHRSPSRSAITPSYAELTPAAPGDLAVRVTAPERIGQAADEKSVPIGIEVTNTTDRWLLVDHPFARVELHEDAQLVEGCGGNANLEMPAIVAPGESFASKALVACAVPDGGAYAVIATVVVGQEDQERIAPTATITADQAALVVDADLAPHGSERIALAETDVTALVHPGAEHPLAEPTEPAS